MTDTPDLGADGPAALARQSSLVTIGGRARSSTQSERIEVRRFAVECQPDWLRAGGQITGLQWRAGMRFRALWLASAYRTRISAAYGRERLAGGTVPDAMAHRHDARSSVTEAMRELTQLQGSAVTSVCGEDESAKGRLRWLHPGLDALAILWRLDSV
jgi:hypothetical protein